MDYNNFIYACIGASLLVIFFTIGKADANAVTTSIVCYYLVAAAIAMLAIQSASTISTTASLGGFMIKMLPFFSIFGIFLCSGILIQYYFDQISENKVSEYYYNFSKISIFMLIIQIGVFLRVIYQKGIELLSRKTLAILGMLATINIIILGTLGITLKYYTTDC